MKKVRTAAVVAVVTTAVTKARDYAREHPDQAERALGTVEGFVRGKAAPKHQPYIDKGSAALRQGLGLPHSTVVPGGAGSGGVPAGVTDPDPQTDEPPVPHRRDDPVAPNPAPGTTDDPQPRRRDDEPAPLTPGERHRS